MVAATRMLFAFGWARDDHDSTVRSRRDIKGKRIFVDEAYAMRQRWQGAGSIGLRHLRNEVNIVARLVDR